MIDLRYLYILLEGTAPADAVQHAPETRSDSTSFVGETGNCTDQEMGHQREPTLVGDTPVVCGPTRLVYGDSVITLKYDGQYVQPRHR